MKENKIIKHKNIIIALLVILCLALALLGINYISELKQRHKADVKHFREISAKVKTKLHSGLQEAQDAIHMKMGILGSPITLVKQGEPYIESGAYCIDDRASAITEFTTDGKVDTNKPGDYEIKYSFTVGNATRSVSRTVRVVETDKFRADNDGVPVLMYHYVVPDNHPDISDKWRVSTSQLEAQMKYLRESNFYFPSFAELRAYIDRKISLPANSVIVTFDDGGKQMFEHGLPIINKFKIPATQFMIGVNSPLKMMRAYAGPYISFQSHGYNIHFPDALKKGMRHHQIGNLSKAELAADLAKIRDIVGRNDAFAYPYGDYTEDARLVLREQGVLCSFTTLRGKVYPGDDPTMLKRIGVYNTTDFDTFLAGL